ncbi:hypothetical protein ABGV17_04735 [Guyparkeria sp. GHLCS8-2]|uniref:hypothetical protein n=1 Tax=Guyparkeria halopsychrophila TaxID=3139421 RepID=UPI0037C9087C
MEFSKQIIPIKKEWRSHKAAILRNQAAWQGKLTPEAVAAIDSVLETLVWVAKQTPSDSSAKGRGVKLATAAAEAQLINVNNTWSQVKQNPANLPNFVMHLSFLVSAMHALYALSARDSEEVVAGLAWETKSSLVELDKFNKNIERHEKELEELVTKAEADSQKVAEQLERVSSLAEDAETKHHSINKKLIEIEARAERLDDIEQGAQSDAKKVEDLSRSLPELETDVQAKIERSNEVEQAMLRLSDEAKEVRQELEDLMPGATSAELAQAYRASKEAIAERMKQTFTRFVLGVVGLGALVIFGFFALPPLPAEPVSLMLQLLARAGLASPAIWFGWVSARQHIQLSKLHEDYAHKEALAKSFVGFRKMMEELDKGRHSDNPKELSSALSARIIEAIGVHPDSLVAEKTHEESPVTYWLSRAMKTRRPKRNSADGSEGSEINNEV